MLSSLPLLETAVLALARECSELFTNSEETAPILLTSPSTPRSQRKEWLNESRIAVDRELSRVLRMQEEFRAAARLLASYRTRLAHACSPVSALPNELLEIILHLACFHRCEHKDARPLMPWTLSHVCSRWRSLVLPISSLWTTIPIKARTKPEFMLAYASRARNSPLTLRVMATKSDSENHSWDWIPATVTMRVSTLEFTRYLAPCWVGVDRMLPNLRDVRLGRAAALDKVTVFSITHPENLPCALLRRTRVLTCHQAVLRIKKNDYGEISRHYPFVSLTVLKFISGKITNVGATLQDLQAPNLQSIWLTDVSRDVRHPPAARRSNHNVTTNETARLQTLHVSGNAMSVGSAGYLMDECAESNHLRSVQVDCISSGSKHVDYWSEGIYRLIHYVRLTKSFSITSPANPLGVVLEALSHHPLKKLDSLVIIMSSQAPPSASEVPKETSDLIKVHFDTIFRARVDSKYPPLPHLRINRRFWALLEKKKAWFAGKVDRLKIVD